jgi:hypothetical protein
VVHNPADVKLDPLGNYTSLDIRDVLVPVTMFTKRQFSVDCVVWNDRMCVDAKEAAKLLLDVARSLS